MPSPHLFLSLSSGGAGLGDKPVEGNFDAAHLRKVDSAPTVRGLVAIPTAGV